MQRAVAVFPDFDEQKADVERSGSNSRDTEIRHENFNTTLGAKPLLGDMSQIRLVNGVVHYYDDMTERVRSVAGARAEFDIGATRTRDSRATLSRVAAGGLVAGKTGAVLGSQFRKHQEDLTQIFATITWPDGGWAQVSDSAAAEASMRKAVARVNAASDYYSAISETLPLLVSRTKGMNVSVFADRAEWSGANTGGLAKRASIAELTSVKTDKMLQAAFVGTAARLALTTKSGERIEWNIEAPKILAMKALLQELIAGDHPDQRPRQLAQQVKEPSAISAADPLELLKQLAQLRDSGIISDEEFAAKKSEILGRI